MAENSLAFMEQKQMFLNPLIVELSVFSLVMVKSTIVQGNVALGSE